VECTRIEDFKPNDEKLVISKESFNFFYFQNFFLLKESFKKNYFYFQNFFLLKESVKNKIFFLCFFF